MKKVELTNEQLQQLKMARILSEQNEFLTIDEAQIFFNVGRFSIDTPINEGKVKIYSPNNKTRLIKKSEFKSYLENTGRLATV